MKSLELILVALQSLTTNKIRSMLTMLGVIIGVGAVIAVVAIGQGAQATVQNQISSLGSNVIIVIPGQSMRGGAATGAGSAGRLKAEHAAIVKERAQFVKAVTPVVFSNGQLIYGNNNWSSQVQGVSQDFLDIRDWTVESGTFFTEQQNRSAAKVCIIGKTIADNLFPNEDPVGKTMRIRNVPFMVIGVLKAKGQTAMGSDQDDIVLAPFATAQKRLRGIDYIHSILASAISENDMAAAQQEITDILMSQFPGASLISEPFTVRTQTEIAEAANETADTFTSLLFSIALVSLLVGGIGIMNIMLVSVTERTKEIGIRRAIGARQGDIKKQFLIEAIFLSLLGGLLGITAGIGASTIISSMQDWPTLISPDSILLALAVSVTIGVFFGYYPANKAANLDVIDALRYE